MNPPLANEKQKAPHRPRGSNAPYSILDERSSFDIDQPTKYLGQTSFKYLFLVQEEAKSGQKKGASQRTPTPTENWRKAAALQYANYHRSAILGR
jgi:hypothetical protein